MQGAVITGRLFSIRSTATPASREERLFLEVDDEKQARLERELRRAMVDEIAAVPVDQGGYADANGGVGDRRCARDDVPEGCSSADTSEGELAGWGGSSGKTRTVCRSPPLCVCACMCVCACVCVCVCVFSHAVATSLVVLACLAG